MAKNSKLKAAAPVQNEAEKVFEAARLAYRSAVEDQEIVAAETRMIEAISEIRNPDMFKKATQAIILIPPNDERRGTVIDALVHNKELFDDISRYISDKPERVGRAVRGGKLESVDSALSEEHLQTLTFYTRTVSQKMGLDV